MTISNYFIPRAVSKIMGIISQIFAVDRVPFCLTHSFGLNPKIQDGKIWPRQTIAVSYGVKCTSISATV